jgi:hypothetical protein
MSVVISRSEMQTEQTEESQSEIRNHVILYLNRGKHSSINTEYIFFNYSLNLVFL